MSFKNIVIAGGGVLGSQIAFQSAYCGFNVTIWLRSEDSIKRTKPKLDTLYKTYQETIQKMDTPEGKSPTVWAQGISDFESFKASDCLTKVECAYNSVKMELDLAKAVKDADLVIEALAENPKEKIAFYKKMAPFSPKRLSSSQTHLHYYLQHLQNTQSAQQNFFHSILQTTFGKATPQKSWRSPKLTRYILTK